MTSPTTLHLRLFASGVPLQSRIQRLVAPDDRQANLTFDPDRKINHIGYNAIDRPQKIRFGSVGSFSKPDPLADEYPWVSPYAYCTGDPINFVDPTGMYTLENIHTNKFYQIICVLPNDKHSIPQSQDLAIASEVKSASEAGMPIIYVNDMEDLGKALDCIQEMNVSFNVVMNINHGNDGKFKIGDENVSILSDFGPLIGKMQDKFFLVRSCSTGNGSSGAALTTFMSGELQCTVITSRNNLVTPCNYFNGSMSYYRISSLTPKGFLISKNGNAASVIHDVVIDAISGISWTDGLFIRKSNATNNF